MSSKRTRFGIGLGIVALGTMVAVALSHVGFYAAVPSVIFVAAFGGACLCSRILFRPVAKGQQAHCGPIALFGHLARRLDLGAKRVLHLISASISAAGVGILAMLPIGAPLGARHGRAGLILG